MSQKNVSDNGSDWCSDTTRRRPDKILHVAINILISKCLIHVPLKRPKEAKKSKFQKERRVLSKKTNLVESFYVHLKLSHNCSLLKNKSAAAI